MLEVITGSMFSGKSTRLIKRVKHLSDKGKHVVVLKPEDDESLHITTHDGLKIKSISINDTDDIYEHIEETDVLALDQVHYFSWDFAPVLNDIASKGIHVITSGLDLDFRGKPFGIVPELMGYADSVTKLQAKCRTCGRIATRSQRIVNGKPAKKTDPIFLESNDDSVQYEARCRFHHTVIE